MNHPELEKKWSELKRRCDYYFSRIIGFPLCPPEQAFFIITNRCNLKCKICNIPDSGFRQENELAYNECKNIIDQIANLKVEHLVFSGGEPLLRRDIFDFVVHAVNRKIRMVDIITNGILLDNDNMAKDLVSSGINHVTVSIDGLEEGHDFIRGQGAFRKAIEAIDFINKHKVNGRPSVGINFTITNSNIGQILPVIALAREKRCNIVVLQPLLLDNTYRKDGRKNELWVSGDNIKHLEEAIAEVIELKDSLQGFSIHVDKKILEYIPEYFSGKIISRGIKCYEAFIRITINPDGSLWTCQGDYGELRKDTLRNAWFSPRAGEIRSGIRSCRNHCLQSCTHLPGMSDVYSSILEFRKMACQNNAGREYSDRLSSLLREYNNYLHNRRQFINGARTAKKII